MRSSVMLAQEKGASNWLSCLPLKSHNFVLHKTAFRDAIALRYHWLPSACPTSCACGHSFTIEHALSCPKGGFPSLRHNEVRDLTANLLSEVCNNVVTEPHLQPLSGETLQYKTANRDDNARLDIAANGFWEDGLRGHTLMSEFLTLVHPQINPYTLHTDVMTRKRDVNTNNGFMK